MGFLLVLLCLGFCRLLVSSAKCSHFVDAAHVCLLLAVLAAGHFRAGKLFLTPSQMLVIVCV